MPRIITSASDPVDFCWHCFPGPLKARALYGSRGDGPDGRGNCYAYNADHPPYEDDPDFTYRCDTCNKPLKMGDDGEPDDGDEA